MSTPLNPPPSDLLKRHAAGHANDKDHKRKRSSSVVKQSRVSQACKTCASSKLKCDEEKPCRRCRERNLHCDRQDVVQDSSPEPQQSIADTSDAGHQPVNMAATVAFSPLPTPMDDFPTASHIMMTPRGPAPQEQVISPELSTGNEQMAIEYGGTIVSTLFEIKKC